MAATKLTEAEWSVMDALWERGELTGREAAELLRERCGWSRSTVLTLLGRMEAKGAVSGESEGGVKVFRPLISREDAAVAETRDFIGRIYNGSLSLMVSALTKKQALPKSEIDELYELLQKLEAGSDG